MTTDELPHNWKPMLYTEERDVEAHGDVAASFADLPAGRYAVVLVAVDPFDAADATWTPAGGADTVFIDHGDGIERRYTTPPA